MMQLRMLAYVLFSKSNF